MNDDLEEKDVVNQEENNEEKKTFTLEEVETMKTQLKDEYEASFDDKFNKRWGKEQRKLARENSEKEELINLLQEQTNTNSVKDLLNLSYKQYGVERPNNRNSEDEIKLGKLDAQEILELDEEAIKEEAERLAGIKRTAREEATFMELGKHLTTKKQEQKRKEEIKEAGIDEKILDNQDFKDFASKFNDNTSVKDIYEIYSKTTQSEEKKKPFSAGSLRNNQKINNDNEFYTEDEFMALTDEQLKNPKIYEKAMKSRLQFK